MKLTNKNIKEELNISKIPLKNFLIEIMEDIAKISILNDKLKNEPYLSEKYINIARELFKVNEFTNLKMHYLANSLSIEFKQIDDLLVKIMKNE